MLLNEEPGANFLVKASSGGDSAGLQMFKGHIVRISEKTLGKSVHKKSFFNQYVESKVTINF